MATQRNAKECYDAGVDAKRREFARITPYYEQPRAEYWWLAGFDGVDFFVAEEKQPEFMIKGVPSNEFPPALVSITPERARELGMPMPNDVERVMISPELLPHG